MLPLSAPGAVTGHHDHHGPAAVRAGARHAGRLRWSFALAATVLVAEVVGGVATGSLVLLSDAGHMLTDVVGLGLALAAISAATRAGTDRGRSFGLYRLEILAALANAALLVAATAYIVVEAVTRVRDPEPVATGAVMAIGAAGLAVNVVAFLLLRPGAAESLNVHGAYLEVLADLVGSVAVVASAAVVAVTGWEWVDPVAGVLLGVWIVPRAWRLAGQAVRVLMQAAPPGLDLTALAEDLAGLPGVVDVHDVHVWTLTSGMDVASSHVMVAAGTDTHDVLDQARALLAERYGVTHATLQVEPDNHRGCDQVTW